MKWKRLGAATIAFLVIIFIVSWQSGTTAEVCEKDKHTQYTECSTHNIALVPFFYSGAVLSERGEAVIAFFTVILAISTIGLWKATNRLWQAGERQMELIAANSTQQSLDMQDSIAANRKAANAAELSARAAVAIELPILRAQPELIISGETRNGDEIKAYLAVARMTFWNHGRTKAFPVEVKSGMFFGKTLPENPSFTATDPFPMNTIFDINPIIPNVVRLTTEIAIPDSASDQLIERTSNLWFYSVLIYEDFMRERREIGHCWKWAVSSGAGFWYPERNSAYNKNP